MEKKISEKELLQMQMEVGGTIQDLIDKYSDYKYVRSAVISGAYRCFKEKKPLNELSIAMASRAIAREEMIKKSGKVIAKALSLLSLPTHQNASSTT